MNVCSSFEQLASLIDAYDILAIFIFIIVLEDILII